MRQRVITGAALGGTLIALLIQHIVWETPAIGVGLYALYFVALYEAISAFRAKGQGPVAWAVYLSGALLMPAYLWKGFEGIVAALFVGAAITLCASIFRRNPKDGDILTACFAIVYPTVPFLALFMLAAQPLEGFLLVFIPVFITSISSDIFALLVGVRFGRHKLIPSVSPNKSWEGAVGGLLASVVFSLLYGFGVSVVFDYGFMPLRMLVIGVLGSVATQLGDLVASVIKRYCGVKDFGNIFPGHGGLLDRIDGMLINALFLYMYFFMFVRSMV